MPDLRRREFDVVERDGDGVDLYVRFAKEPPETAMRILTCMPLTDISILLRRLQEFLITKP